MAESKKNGLAADVSERILGRWAGALLAVIGTVLMAGTGWVVASTISLQRDVAVISSNRFTSSDSTALERRIQARVDARLDRIERKLDGIEDALRERTRPLKR